MAFNYIALIFTKINTSLIFYHVYLYYKYHFNSCYEKHSNFISTFKCAEVCNFTGAPFIVNMQMAFLGWCLLIIICYDLLPPSRTGIVI